jgi:hypothetical protein
LENYIENKYILKSFNVKNKYTIEALKSQLNDEAKSFVNNIIKNIEERIIERHIRHYTYRDKKENERLFYDRTDIVLLIHLIEQLKKYKRKWIIESESIDDPAEKIYEKILKTKEKALEYLQNKKYKMREYRLRQYIIKRFNEDTQDDFTDILNYYFSNDMDFLEKENIIGKENIDFFNERAKEYTAEYKKQRNVKTDK